ncbi:MAG: hypothetical protein NC112_03165 [Oxalobacter formigenes]|nr:hypothetical protein [Oxalobacter formigenes]
MMASTYWQLHTDEQLQLLADKPACADSHNINHSLSTSLPGTAPAIITLPLITTAGMEIIPNDIISLRSNNFSTVALLSVSVHFMQPEPNILI